MNIVKVVVSLFLLSSIIALDINAEVIHVTTQREFDDAHDRARANDTISWRSGTYSDIFMDVTKDRLYIRAEVLGGTIFTGNSRADIDGDFVTFEGFQYLNGDIGDRDVINVTGSNNLFTQLNIRAYTCYKYLRVREESQYVDITFCNFENRLNLDDQNILSILVDDNNPGYHRIQYCSFKNFDGTGNDLGIEPIRIGVSTQADYNSRTVVEFCYFTQCNGDGELISNKASQNVIRHNTFYDNPRAEVVLRHGSESIVYGNFFLNGKGGVRVREGQDHYIYNNYFYEIDDRAIYLQNESSDPLDNINIAFNTIIDCSEFILGGDGSFKPTNVTIANNVFADPDDNLFEEATGDETWINNITSGDLGITRPSSGLRIADPQLVKNSAGFFGPTENSPTIDGAGDGFAPLPQYEGIEGIDSDLDFDLMRDSRPGDIEEKDLGCSEFPERTMIQPFATEENTGPSYNTSTSTSLIDRSLIVDDLISISPNPMIDVLNVNIQGQNNTNLHLDIIDFTGRTIDVLANGSRYNGETELTQDLSYLPAGRYTVRAIETDSKNQIQRFQTIKFIKAQ